jgi:hypothetical protein
VQAKSRVALGQSVEIRDYRTQTAKAKAGTGERAPKSLRGGSIHRTKLSKTREKFCAGARRDEGALR